MLSGAVSDFDGFVGRGVIAAADGRRFGFHCTQIADGSRTISAGTAVTFELMPGPLGRWEATAITKT